MATAVPLRSVPTNGFPKRASYKFKNPPADLALDDLRAKILARKEALGVRFIDISRQLRPSNPCRQQAEYAIRKGGFRGLARVASILGFRVAVELVDED